MKILYVATARTDAQAVAAALHSAGPAIRVLWASDFDHAANWIRQRRDVTAVVVESQLSSESLTSFLMLVRKLGLKAPVVVVSAESASPELESTNVAAGVIVAKNLRELPGVLARAIGQCEPMPSPAVPVDTTTINAPKASPDLAAPPKTPDAAPAAADRLAQWQAELGVRLADALRSRSALEGRLADLEASVRNHESSLAAQQSAAAARHAEIERLLGGERASRLKAEEELAAARSALLETNERHASAMRSAVAQLAERQARHDIALARAAATREMVDEQFRQAAVEVELARQKHLSAVADLERLSRRETELALQLADATAMREGLELRLTEAAAALQRADETAGRELQTLAERAAAREHELGGLLGQERAARADVERTLAEAQTALREAEERHAAAASSASALLAERQAQFEGREQELLSQLATAGTRREALEREASEAAAARTALEQQLQQLNVTVQELNAALDVARQNHASAAADVERLTTQERELDGLLGHERATRSDLEQTLAQAQTALREAEERHAAAAASASALLAERQAQFEGREQELFSQLATAGTRREALEREASEAAAARTALEQQLQQLNATVQELNAALDLARQNHVSAAADVDRLTTRERELDELLGQERTARADVDQILAQAQTTLREVEERHAAAAALLAQRQAQFEGREQELLSQLATAGTTREALEREASEVAAARTALEQQLQQLNATVQELNAALAVARQNHASAAADVERLTTRERELDGLLGQERATHSDLEQTLAEAQTTLREAEERHAAAASSASALLAERQAQFEGREQELLSQLATAGTTREALEREASEAAAARTALEQQLQQLNATLQERNAALDIARQNHASAVADVERLTAREQELDALVGHERATRSDLEQTLAQAQTALREAEERHAEAAASASALLAERQAQFEGREQELFSQLATAGTTREALEREASEVAAARTVLEQQRQELNAALEISRQHHASAAAEVERLTGREAELVSRLADAGTTRETLEIRLTEAAAALKHADERALQEQQAASARQADVEGRLAQEVQQRETLERERRDQERRLVDLQEQTQRLAAERDSLAASIAAIREQMKAEAQQHLQELRRDFQRTLDHASNEHAAAVATLVASVNERDARLKEQATRHAAALQASENERTEIQTGLRTTLAARNREIEQLKEKVTATGQELETTRSRRDALQIEANRVPQLQKRLDDFEAEIRRQFEQSPLALCRCTRDGSLMDANRALEVLIGCRRPADLRSQGFAAVFESPGDLSWLIERCLKTRVKESVETTWKHRNGGRLFIRLSGVASSTDTIEIVAEDLTNLHILENRLGQAHRMEAVGRLASEVAVTCGNLLKEIHQGAEQWLATVSSHPSMRQQGELVLDEVTRAASYLRQLAAYGNEETRALDPMDLNRVIRDLEPVLRRVAGDAVELQVRKTSSPLHVDVKTTQAERLFVNLASYCRERMPHGGRLKIELATSVVDGRFIAEHPNMRLGPHALITVTEVKRTTPLGGTLGLRGDASSAGVEPPAPKPGVDLGVLQALIGECNGHLWMTVEPGGDMVAKIHLPLHASYDAKPAHLSVLRGAGGRLAARFLQN